MRSRGDHRNAGEINGPFTCMQWELFVHVITFVLFTPIRGRGVRYDTIGEFNLE